MLPSGCTAVGPADLTAVLSRTGGWAAARRGEGGGGSVAGADLGRLRSASRASRGLRRGEGSRDCRKDGATW